MGLTHWELARSLDPTKRYFVTPARVVGFHNVKQPKPADYKPWGLWYACGAEWIQLALAYQDSHWWEMQVESWKYLYEIDVRLDAMKVIRTDEELAQFSKVWTPKGLIERIIPDWRKLAKRYAGIEICPHLEESRHQWSWYGSWDVASGCVWNEAGLKSLFLLAEKTAEGWVTA